jgi:SAM-dependent methyltransferase
MRTVARKVKYGILNWFDPARKARAELRFWQEEIFKYQQWFRGDLKNLYKTPSPTQAQKVAAPNLKDASVLTWHRLHQEVKYLQDLNLGPEAFRGKRVLDIGSGPFPSATCFNGIQLYCLDPLWPDYLKAGFPLHYYNGVHFVHGSSEKVPLPDGFFDVIIAVNSIDHVDHLERTAQEFQRVLQPRGWLRMHVHYHRTTITEPLELNDAQMTDLFCWCENFKKIKECSENTSGDLPADERFALWSNF